MHDSKRLVIAVGAFACVSLAPAAAYACNPFELLFGGCRQPAPVRQAPALEPLLDEAPVKKRAPVEVKITKQSPLRAPAGVRTGSIEHFSGDETLRSGDVVVTPNGFLIYRGGSGNRSASAFQPLKAGRSDLAKLEQASKIKGGSEWSAQALAVSQRAETLVQRPGSNDRTN